MEHVLRPQPGYPFTLALNVEYGSTSGLQVRTTASNLGDEACPYGSGAHPYLTVGTETIDAVLLRAPGRIVLHSDDRGLPIGAGSVEGTEYDFRRPRPIGSTKLDHAFTDLKRDQDGRARVELAGQPGIGLTLWVDEAYGYLMLFTAIRCGIDRQPRRRTDDLPTECVSDGRVSGPPRTGLVLHERLGHHPVVARRSAPSPTRPYGTRSGPRTGSLRQRARSA
jgi:aldose 1-epimerase